MLVESQGNWPGDWFIYRLNASSSAQVCGWIPLWPVIDGDSPLGSDLLDKEKLIWHITLFPCHHLSVALLNTSTICSRTFSQKSPGQMLHIHSRLLTNSTLTKHLQFFRWVEVWLNLTEIAHWAHLGLSTSVSHSGNWFGPQNESKPLCGF